MTDGIRSLVRGSRATTLLLALLVAGWVIPVSLAQNLSLTDLALSGDFQKLQKTLSDWPSSDAKVLSLRSDLERLAEHQQQQAAQRLEQFHQAIEKARKAESEEKLDQALAHRVEAHRLAVDPQAFLADGETVALAEKAKQVAEQAELKQNWFESLTLYRSLEALYEDRTLYRDKVKLIERQVRMLRLYAPQEFARLYEERAKRLGKEKIEPLALGDETWQDQLKGVQLSMLRQALAQAARRHISTPGYAPLILGSIDAMQALIRTQSLSSAFANLNDPVKVQAFAKSIEQMRQEIVRRGESYSFLDAARTLDAISEANDRTIQLPAEVLAYELGDGAMGTLDDFTGLLWPKEKEELMRTTQGKFYGVGIQISRRDGRLVVVSPLEGTPAQRAGIKPGDFIVSVDQRSTAGWSLDQAVRNITGPEGTPVSLGIERPGQSQPLTFPLKRAEIVIESVRGWIHPPSLSSPLPKSGKSNETPTSTSGGGGGGGWDYFVDHAARIGYVRISQFIPQTADDLDRAINEMEQAGGLSALVVDLRYNPGGLLGSAVEVSNRFVSRGVIVSTVEANGKMTAEVQAKPQKSYAPFPVAVLVNEGSASASEIVAGCLQDHHRAVIIGQRSFGKGSVQDLVPLDNGKAFLKLTTQYYRLPNKRIIHRQAGSTMWGIQPDIQCKSTPKEMADLLEFRQNLDILQGSDPVDSPADSQPASQPATAQDILTKGLDPQLETAIVVLKAQLLDNARVVMKPATK